MVSIYILVDCDVTEEEIEELVVELFDETGVGDGIQIGALLVPAIVEKSGSFPLSSSTFNKGEDFTVLLRVEA